MSLLLLFTTPGAAAPGIVARGIVAGGQYDAHHARRRARLVAAAGALLLVPAVRAGAATTIEGTGTLSAPIATVTGTGGPPATGAPVARGIVTVDYRAHFAAQRRARLDAAPSQIVLGAQRLPPVVGSGTLAAPIATLAGASADLLLGSGVLSAPVASVTGAGVGVVTGAGTLSAPIAQLLGTETRPPRLRIDVRLAPMLALEPSLAATLTLAAQLSPVLRVEPSLDPGP